ncbi:MAG: 50S ribosomal protein L29 [Dehalococcoidia bacterium]|nr:50S ribosomal protein L29 [Dehalococcoidia bacterium]
MNQKAEELRVLSDVDLKAELEATHKELFITRFRLATRQLANSWQMVIARKKIARIKTILRERELLGAAE